MVFRVVRLTIVYSGFDKEHSDAINPQRCSKTCNICMSEILLNNKYGLAARARSRKIHD